MGKNWYNDGFYETEPKNKTYKRNKKHRNRKRGDYLEELYSYDKKGFKDEKKRR